MSARTRARSSRSIFVVAMGGYHHDVIVASGMTLAEACAAIDAGMEGLTESDREHFGAKVDSTLRGRTISLDCGVTVIWLREWSLGTRAIAQLAHEIFHAVTMVFDGIGMKLSSKSDEAYAYAIEDLTHSILGEFATAPAKRNRLDIKRRRKVSGQRS